MHPRQVDELYPDEYFAMVNYALREQHAEQRALRKAKSGRG